MQAANVASAKENLAGGKPRTARGQQRTAFGERGQNGVAVSLQQQQQQLAQQQQLQLAQQQHQAALAQLQVGRDQLAVQQQPLAAPQGNLALATRDPTIEDIDAYDHEDPAFCTEYVEEIFAYMKEKELCDPITNYMVHQVDISEKHRMILVDWMAEVTVKFRLLVETMFLAVNILDRFLQQKAVARSKLQLVGVTSLLIASKYEEILTPEVNDFIWITAKAYTHDEILKMERLILVTLDFELSIPTPLHFLRRYSKAARSDSTIHTLSKYITEVSMVDYQLTGYRPSHIAAAAVYIARNMTDQTPAWSKTLAHYTGITEAELLPCARDLNRFLETQSTSRFQATYKKYAQDKLLAVSRIPTKSL